MATGSDQAVGYGLVVFAGAIFLYYTLWVVVLPFVEPDQFLHNLFLPRAYAVILPLVAGVIVLTFIGIFAVFVMLNNKKKKK